ncbi:MAG: plastocyanin/azurin family copper-binding protein [Planctomycetota bacterium]|nr:plastocyanin/azurin family copper-binding protein [Planctomycetota bacterium]
MSLIRSLCALLLLAPGASAEVVEVRQYGFYFSPREIVIQPGDTVRWIWTSGTHTVTEGTDGLVNGNELFHSALTGGVPVFSFTFTPAFLALHPMPGGRYDYFCQPHFHLGMTGIVRVADPVPGSIFCSGDGSGAPCPCANASAGAVGCLNSVLAGGRLRSIGAASVAADSLELWASGAPEGSNVIFFQGSSTQAGGAGIPFGDGLRCAGGTLMRLGTQPISFGWARYPGPSDPRISVRGAVPPGSTRHYQAWYLDSPGACGAVAPNWTNGYSVVWQ